MTDAPNMPKQDSLEKTVSLDEESSGSKKGLAILVLFILLTAVGGGLYFSGLLDGLLGKETTEVAATKKTSSKAKDAGTVAFLPIPDMIVNLNSESGQSRYLRLSVQLELESQEDLVAVQAVLPRIIDQFQTYLRELRVSDLRGSKGIYRLQVELLNRVNTAAAPINVKDVLFQEILIQ